MEKLKLFCVAFAASVMIFACQNKREQGRSGTGQSEGLSNRSSDAKEMAEDINEERFKTDSAKRQSDFMTDAADGGMFEVQAAKLVMNKARSQKVKDFAKLMEKDHSKANDELKALASKHNVTLPTSLSEDKQDKINKLNKLSGTDLDREYMDMMVKDHKEDVRKFKDEAKGKTEGDVEAWAAKTVPILEKHLEMAKQTQDEIKDNMSARNNPMNDRNK